MSFRENKELAEMESTINQIETEVADLEALLNDGAVFKERASEVPALLAKLEAGKVEIDRLYARWGELEAKRVASGAA